MDKKRVLVCCESLEDKHWRGIDNVALNIIDSLKRLGNYEVGYLSGLRASPIWSLRKTKFFFSKALYLTSREGILKYYSRAYSSKLLAYLLENLKALLIDSSYFIYTRDLHKKVIEEENSLNKWLVLSDKLDFIIAQPLINQSIRRNVSFLVRKFIDYIVEKYSIDIIIFVHPSIYKLSNNLKSKGVKLIHYFHDLIPFKNPEFVSKESELKLFKAKAYSAIKNSDVILCNSYSTREELIQYFNEPKLSSKLHVVYAYPNFYLYNSDFLKKEEQIFSKFSSLLGIFKKEYFVFISSVEKRKNLKNILLAIKKLLKSDLWPWALKLVVIGHHGNDDNYVELIKEINAITKVIIITGYLSDIDKFVLLKNAISLVYPSFYEGLGIPVMEAIALGVPVICTKVGGLAELVNEDTCLLINDPNSVEEISLKFLRAIANRQDIARRSSKAYEYIMRNFSYFRFDQRLSVALDTLVS